MNRKELNLLDMFKSLDVFLSNNGEVLAEFLPITTSHIKLKATIVDIDNLSRTQAKDTKTASTIKAEEKIILDETILKVTAAMAAIAAQESNTELRLIAAIEKTTLRRLRQNDYKIKVEIIYKTALTIKEKLKVWGVTDEDLEILSQKSDGIVNSTPDIRNMKVVSKQATTEIREKVNAQLADLRATLDLYMKPFKSMNPTLYGQYLNARQVLDKSATQKKIDEIPAAAQ